MSETRMQAVPGLWPQIQLQLAGEDAVLLVELLQGFALSRPHEQLEGSPVEDHSWTRFDDLVAHHAFHQLARPLAEQLLATVPQPERARAEEHLNPAGWARLAEPWACRPEWAGCLVVGVRIEHWTRVGDLQALQAALGHAAANLPRAAQLLQQLGSLSAPLQLEPLGETELELQRTAGLIEHSGQCGSLWWHAEQGHAWWVLAEADRGQEFTPPQRIQQLLGGVSGVRRVSTEPAPPTRALDTERGGWILLEP